MNYIEINPRRRLTRMQILRMSRRQLNSLLFALENADPPPCGDCSHYQRCVDYELACADFAAYVNDRAVARGAAGRRPSRMQYLAIYGQEEEEDNDG